MADIESFWAYVDNPVKELGRIEGMEYAFEVRVNEYEN